MKHKILVSLLAVFLVLFLLPGRALADEGYAITAEVVGSCHGHVELEQTHAAAGEVVWLLVEPEEGYLVQIDGVCESNPGNFWVTYAGLGRYAVNMPAGDVALQIRFVPAEGELYTITGTVNDPDGGELVFHRTAAREGEWVAVEVKVREGFFLRRLTAQGTDGLPVQGGYADVCEGGFVYEYCLPNVDVVIEAEFVRDPRAAGGVMPLLLQQINSIRCVVLELCLAALFC